MKDTLVLVNYFAGWRREVPNFWHDKQGDWRPRFPGLVPLLGEYNEPDTMDREIVAASDHGVDAFLILWYYKEPGSADDKRWGHLNKGLSLFLASPEARRMKFAIEWCNHEPFIVTTEERWQYCLGVWMDAMKHPSYLRVGGRPVFKVHTGPGMVTELGGDMDAVRRRLRQLRDRVRSEGLGEILLGGGGLAVQDRVVPDHWMASAFDFTNIYNAIPPVPQREENYPFDDYIVFTEANRMRHDEDAVPFMPYLCAGWNRRPWPDDRPYFEYPNREQWVRELRNIKRDLDASRRLGLPLPNGGRQKAFNIFAWNEFGEGGIVAPTRGDGYMKLEGIREVFGS